MSSDIRVLLVPSPAFKGKRLRSYHPIGLYSLQSAARGEQYDVEVLNLEGLSNLHDSPLTTEIGEAICALFDPAEYDMVGLMTISGSLPIMLYVAQRIRAVSSNTSIVLGGPHASFLHAETLEDFPFVDAVVVGEGEASFLAMLKAYRRGTPEEWVNIEGVATRQGKMTPRTLISHLDALPFIDFRDRPQMSGDVAFARIEALRAVTGGANSARQPSSGIGECGASPRHASSRRWNDCTMRLG